MKSLHWVRGAVDAWVARFGAGELTRSAVTNKLNDPL